MATDLPIHHHSNSFWSEPQFVVRLAVLVLNTPCNSWCITKDGDGLHSSTLFWNLWSNAQLTVCADGGANRLYDRSVALNVHHQVAPLYIKGDLDSLRSDVRDFFEAKGTTVLRDSDQNSNDLDKCLQLIYQQQTESDDRKFSVMIFGAMGGRFDQEMQNINALFKWKDKFEQMVLLSDDTTARLLEPNVRHIITPNFRFETRTCGLIPIAGTCKDITTSGLKWNLSSGMVTGFGELISSSNYVDDLCEQVEVVASHPLIWTTELGNFLGTCGILRLVLIIYRDILYIFTDRFFISALDLCFANRNHTMQFFKHLTDPALKRLYKFVLKRMIGRFLAADELDLDQLDVHLRSGRLELCDLLLNAEVLNAELCEAYGLPFKVKKGYLGSVRVAISYTNIMSESCLVEIDDIEIILVPLETEMTSTRQKRSTLMEKQEIKQEMQQEKKSKKSAENRDEISQEGLDFVASWIEQVTSKIKVTLSNVCLRLETGEQHKGRDVALLCQLHWAQFTDESVDELSSFYGRNSSVGLFGSHTLDGGTQSMAASSLFGVAQKGIKFRGLTMDLHLSSDESSQKDVIDRRRTEYSDMVLHSFLSSSLSIQNYFQVKISHYEAFEAPAIDADMFFHSIRIVLQPQYFPELEKIVNAFSTDPVKLTASENYTSTSLFESICSERPAWLTGSEQNDVNEETGALNLSLKEFERIEELLRQYRQTQEILKKEQRRRYSAEESSTERQGMFRTRKLSAAESVESVGLSELEDEEDTFFECETGLASSVAPSASLSYSKLSQSLYASANETYSKCDDQTHVTWSTTAAQNRAARRVQSRFKAHLLECEIVFLYDDLPDVDEENETVEEDDESLAENRIHRAPVQHTTSLPSVNGLERLELSLKDIICSSLVYSQYFVTALTIGKVTLTEKTLPRMLLDTNDGETAMLSTCVLEFADTSPFTGQKASLSKNVSAQLRIDFEPASDDMTPSTIASLGVRVNVQPVLFEWDMYLLDRTHRLLALLEQDTSATKRNVELTSKKNQAQEFVKALDMTTDCVQMTLRFPMVNSDLIRFGVSSKRGLCEDRIVLSIKGMNLASHSSQAGVDDDEGRSPMLPQHSKRTSLPWLAEFDASFDTMQVAFLIPELGNQRSLHLEKVVLFDACSDERLQDVCTLKLRLQTPSRDEVKEAITSKQNLSQDSSHNPDILSEGNFSDEVSGDDNDGGRVGLNGWNLDALGRVESFEAAAAEASLYSMEVGLPRATAILYKSSLDRIMVLFDALLTINPTDVDIHNDVLNKALHRNRLTPNFMSFKLMLGEGAIQIRDYVAIPALPFNGANPTSVRVNQNVATDRQSDLEKVLFTYHFVFQSLKIFQVSQWMGQLVSRVHVSAQNTTLLEENGRTNAIVPILYKTPFGDSKAPIFFMGVDITDQTNEMREMNVELHVSHLTLRYDVHSRWMMQLLEILLIDYPVPIIPLDSATLSNEESLVFSESIKNGGDYDAVPLAIDSKTVFTKLFVKFYDVLVDYAPVSLTSRMILLLGKVDVYSNVVTGAIMQGYKISIGDLELFMTHAHAGYEEIDQILLGNEIFLQNNAKSSMKKAVKFAATYAVSRETLGVECPSLLKFLETFGFLQLVTMDFLDIFLRVLVQPTAIEAATASRDQLEQKLSAAAASPELSVELNLGTANIYACFDSFNTLIELLSVWTDQLAIKPEPQDTTAYVGMDGTGDISSVSVVTNLNHLPASSAWTNGLTLSERSNTQGFSTSSSVCSERLSIDNSEKLRRDSFNIMEQIDQDAFGSGKTIFPGKIVATDTEARLLRTRMNLIQKEKERIVQGLDNELSASELRLRYQLEERRKSVISVPMSELVIEDYYAHNRSFGEFDGEPAGAFLMEPHENADQDDPWFASSSHPPSPSQSPEQTAMPYKEETVRWLPLDGARIDSGIRGSTSPMCRPYASVFEAMEDKAPIPMSVQLTHNNDRLNDYEDNEVDEFEANKASCGAFPAASKNLWKMQRRHHDVEMSEGQTEETASSFSHQLDLIEGSSVTEADSEGMDGRNANTGHPTSMSMSFIDTGGDEGKEVKLEFDLDQDLQSQINQMLNVDLNDGYEFNGDESDQVRDEQRSNASFSVRKMSFSSNGSHPGAPTSSIGQPSMSPPDQPTARWFYDEQRSDDGSLPNFGPPSRIYPHHVEIPVGGSASSLSFGEKECNDAIRSIARENAMRKVEATPPIVIQHVLLRNFNICMRFFGGFDWTRDASEAVKLCSFRETDAAKQSKDKKIDSATAKEKLLDALLDDYVPSGGGDLFEIDSSSAFFGGAKSAPTTSFMTRDPAMRSRAASSDFILSRKRALNKSGRKTEEMLELVVTRIQFRVDMFNKAETQSLASHSFIALGDLELLDYISTSQIRKIICYWKSEATHPRESGSSMAQMQLITVRPGPNLCEEHRLKARLLPLRINLDQEVVKFLRQFVPPKEIPTQCQHQQSMANLDETEDDDSSSTHEDGREMMVMGDTAATKSVGAWFFQSIDIKPCKIKIDYRPNHIDFAALRAGDYLEVINLFVLEGMELVLRRVQMSGLDGWVALGEAVLISWVQDISRRQIHKCVASVSMPPLRPFVNIGAGAADLILLPLEHYGRDRRFVRGLKKGASSFLKSVTIETLTTVSKVAQGTQALLEHADGVVSSSSELRRKHLKYRQAGSRIARNSRRMGGGGIRNTQDAGGGIGGRQYLIQQPASASEGFGQAYDSLARELHVAAKTIVAVPLVEYRKTGSQGYVRSVIRAVPVAVLRPMIGASEAVAKALIGVRNAVDPEMKEDIENKFKDFRAN
ncbi:putative vacuolar protein sorting-associated protein [Plasmopara halstedii]